VLHLAQHHLVAAIGGVDPDQLLEQEREPPLRKRVHRQDLQHPDPDHRFKERNRLARTIADHLFEEFADIPLFWFANEVVANPKVVSEWVYPGSGPGGRPTSISSRPRSRRKDRDPRCDDGSACQTDR